jgi:protein-tyrosine kinase
MSEFFKALEQAERDRTREAGAADAVKRPSEARPTPAEARPTPAEARPTPAEARPTPAEARPTPAEARPTQAEARPKRAASEPAPAEPRLSVKAARVVATPPPSVTAEPSSLPVQTSSIMDAPPPSRVFRPSLRKQDGFRARAGLKGRLPVLVVQTEPASIEAQAYRTIRANTELMSANGSGVRRLAITSASSGEGKSTTAANLAAVAAQGGRRVCLVDADLHRPMLHQIFGLPNVNGLVTALAQDKPLQSVAKSADIENLSVVVAGRAPGETFQDVLSPERLNKMLQESEDAFDLVVFDTPPIVSADALNVASVCGGVVLVVRAGHIPFSVLRRAVAQVTQVKGRVLGVVLNRFNPRADNAASYHYYAYPKGPAQT